MEQTVTGGQMQIAIEDFLTALEGYAAAGKAGQQVGEDRSDWLRAMADAVRAVENLRLYC